MHSTAISASASTWAPRDFEVLDRVRCIDTPGLAQLQVGQLYTIKHVLPGGLLVLTEFSRVRAFHPSYFMLAGQQERRSGV
jgi:hypothetical protein